MFDSHVNGNTFNMSQVLGLCILFLGFLRGCSVAGERDHGCPEFNQGVTFNDEEALGTWHLLHHLPYNSSDGRNSLAFNCLVFHPVTDEERNEVRSRIGAFVENLKWENLTLKMQISCSSPTPNPTDVQYLEKLDSGSYKILQEPSHTANLNLQSFRRYFYCYQLKLKMVEHQYLAMMECQTRSVFLLGRVQDDQTGPDQSKLIEAYWPEIN